ncbi:GNAT family N-acetyltransferase [candidate division WOR-3 bacterium]|nr:GNAT family N-acetyltransferase [candidate division WOR-3 bacterium]
MKFDTLSNNPKLIDVINDIHSEPWPTFLSEDEIIKKYWRSLYEIYPQYQLLFKEETDYVGLANCFPIDWDGKVNGLPAGFDQAVEVILKNQQTANCLCALAIVVRKKYSGKGISSEILKVVKEIGNKHGFTKLIIPVRPTLKSKYPLVSMKNYMQWEKSELPFDPWLKIHVKNGGKIVKEANPSMVVKGTVAQWQEWTGMYFGNSGDYVVEGALNPVCIDLENDFGEYVEPNVWVLHEF